MTIPSTMRAVVLTGHGGLDKLEYRENWPKPVASGGEVLVRVLACGLNNTDINTRSGWYSKDVTGATTGDALPSANADDATWGGRAIVFPRIQGADVCGIVEAVGDGVDSGLIGKRVLIDTWLRDWNDPHNRNKTGYFGSECNGGYAEYTVVNAMNIHPINSDYSDAELATFATSYSTAEGMLNRAQVSANDTVLITGASGGVGSALIQLAKRRNARIVALCGEDKAESVRAIGADFVLPRCPENLSRMLEAAIGEKTVSVVADVVGGDYWPQLLEALSRGGRYTCSGAIAGPIVSFDLRTFYLNDLTLTGSTVLMPGVFADLVGYIERKEIVPILAAAYPLAELREAQRKFIGKKFVGNIVVQP